MRTQGHASNPTELDPTTRLLNYPPPELRRMLNDASVIRRLGTQLTERFVADLYRRGQQASGRDGWPAGGGGARGSDISRPTEAAAVANADAEPGERDMVGVWVNEVRALLDHLAGAANDVSGKVGLIEKAGSTERPNTVELCAECNEPAPKVKRLDGQPYHPETCWWKVYNRIRGRRGA